MENNSIRNPLCTIGEALLVERQIFHKSASGDDNCPRLVGRGGVDIVGIVLNVSFQIYYDKVLTFLITDSSLPNGCFVKVIVRGDNTNATLSKVMNGSIQQGDAVRWNGLALRRNSYNSTNNNGSLLGEFHICHQPTSTISFFKLGSLLLLPPTLQKLQTIQQQEESMLEDCESTVFDVVEDEFVPLDMITPRTLVHDLLDWYYTSFHKNNDPIGNKNQLSIGTIGPCKRRKLHEITLPNLMSDIVVQIHSFYKNTIHSTSITRTKWGQCRPTLVAFAVVRDGEQEEDFAMVQILTISNHYQHLSSALQQCADQGNRQGCWVLIRQVLSQSNAYVDDLRQRQKYHYRYRQQLMFQGHPNNDTGNIFLLTTCETTVSILHENPYKNKKKNQQVQQHSLPHNGDLIYDDPSPIHSPPSIPSHYHLPVPIEHQNISGISNKNSSLHQPFYASLFNIYFSDLDFYLFHKDGGTKSYYDHMQNKTYRPKLCVSAGKEKLISMISSPPPLNTYGPTAMRSATLILEYSERLHNERGSLYQQSHNGIISAIADEEIMELLCGGVPLKDIESYFYNDCGTFHDDASSSQLLLVVANMLVALVEENISLIWSVEQRDDKSWYVTDVRLPAL